MGDDNPNTVRVQFDDTGLGFLAFGWHRFPSRDWKLDEREDWGCEHCRNDGALNDNGVCPKCDAQYPGTD